MALVFLLVAFVCFALAAFGVPTGRVNLVALGLAFFTLAALTPSFRALDT
jgi:hypothetical protein